MAVAGAATSVVIVKSERSAAYSEAAQALVDQLERVGVSPAEITQLTVSDWKKNVPATPKIFVALGTEAAELLARNENRAPVLCGLLPRNSFERALLGSGRKSSPLFSALYLDQPAARQVALLRLALPAVHRVGIVWGPESQVHTAVFKDQLQTTAMELVEASVGRDEPLFPALSRVLEDAQVLLAVPDTQVYNSSTIQNILLTSFRVKVPLVAFSPAYVRAGALLALYQTPTQVGQQIAAIARGLLLQGKPLSALPAYPHDFSIAVNERVARSLGLKLSAEVLLEQLRSREAAAP